MSVTIKHTIHPVVVCKSEMKDSSGDDCHVGMVSVDMARFTITIENDMHNEKLVWEFDPLDQNSPLYMSATLKSLAESLDAADDAVCEMLNGRPVAWSKDDN